MDGAHAVAHDGRVDSRTTAAARALDQVEAVRDAPEARLELLARSYHGPAGDAPQHLPFRRAALSFMRWQVNRGVLAPPGADASRQPVVASRQRAAASRRLRGRRPQRRTGAERRRHRPSSCGCRSSSNPTARTWYRAHNASIVGGLPRASRPGRRREPAERFFLNVVLLRVLYAHALVAAPRLALGRLAVLGPVLGDPRLSMTGIFLSLSRVLPARYPLGDEVAAYIAAERNIGQALDYGLIGPRLQPLYEWSANELDEPALLDCVRDGSPTYAWPFADRDVWQPARPPFCCARSCARALR